jgi:hypothetical protein
LSEAKPANERGRIVPNDFTLLFIGENAVARESSEKKFVEATRARALFLCLDGVRFARGICTASYERALGRFRTFETADIVATGAPAHEVMLAVADIWSVVDSANRVRILAQRTPHLQRTNPEVEAFLRATSDVEKMRNYMQHIDQEITEISDRSTPLWGSISWQTAADPNTQITLLTGTKHIQYRAVGLVYDTLERKFVRPFELVVGEVTLDVDDVVRRVGRLNELLIKWTATFELGSGERYVYQPERVPLVVQAFQLGTLAPNSASQPR